MKFTITPPEPALLKDIERLSLRRLGNSVARAVDDTGKVALDRTHTEMKNGRLGKLAGAIGYTSDHKKRQVPDAATTGARWRAGAIMFSRRGSERTDGALEAYSSGSVTILPKRGRWLAFATRELAARVPGIRGAAKGSRRSGTYRITPALYVRRGLDRRIGSLVFIKGRNPSEALLIVKNVQVNAKRGFGGAKRIPRTGRIAANKKRVDFIIAFVLIRVTRRSQRFNGKANFEQSARQLPDRILARLTRGQTGATAAQWRNP